MTQGVGGKKVKSKGKNTVIVAILGWLKQPYFERTHHAKRKCRVI